MAQGRREKTPSNYRADGLVYLLWGEGTQAFKIGWTGKGSLDQRVKAIQSNSPVDIIPQGCIAGGVKTERELHHQLRAYRAHGEWFRLPEEVAWQMLALFGVKEAQDRYLCDGSCGAT